MWEIREHRCLINKQNLWIHPNQCLLFTLAKIHDEHVRHPSAHSGRSDAPVDRPYEENRWPRVDLMNWNAGGYHNATRRCIPSAMGIALIQLSGPSGDERGEESGIVPIRADRSRLRSSLGTATGDKSGGHPKSSLREASAPPDLSGQYRANNFCHRCALTTQRCGPDHAK